MQNVVTEYLNSGRTLEALQLFTQLEPHQLLPESMYSKAIALSRLNRVLEAIASLKQLLTVVPNHSSATHLLTELQELTLPWKTLQTHGEIPFASFNLLTPTTLARLATSQPLWEELLSFHHLLITDEHVAAMDAYYRECLRWFGQHWYFMDVVNVVFAAAKILQPRTYLEIGVRRGRSSCAVARACPTVDIFAFDMWVADYAGMDNPGTEFVAMQLQRHGHQGKVTFVEGNSHETLPKFFQENPDLQLDLITVDGDHSETGAMADLYDVIPHLAVGGVLIFDDVAHPAHPYLLQVWQQILEKFPDLAGFEFVEAGYGVGFAVRKDA